MSEYENETCEGCVIVGSCEDGDDGPGVCLDFKPSLQCRQVRALETMAEYLGGCVRAVPGGFVLEVTNG